MHLTNVKPVSVKFAGSQPQAGNRRGALANEVFAGLVGPWIICENYLGSYYWDMQLTCRTYNLNIIAGPWACHSFQSLGGHCLDISQYQIMQISGHNIQNAIIYIKCYVFGV